MRGSLLNRWRTFSLSPGGSTLEDSSLTYVGPLYDGYHCWEPTDAARKTFVDLAPRIKAQLESCCDTIPSLDWVSFFLYMVGKSPNQVSPTILFVCMDSSQAKKARAVIKETGILKSYPDIKTAHSDKDPGVNNLEQFAQPTKCLTQSHENGQRPTTAKVFYDATNPILSSGMAIYVPEEAEGLTSMRKATATIYRSAITQRIFYLTVFHAFINTSPQSTTNKIKSDDDIFGIDSDVEDDDELNVAITSIGSRSPDSLSEYSLSNSDVSESRSARSASFSDCSTKQDPRSPTPGSVTSFESLELVNESLIPYTGRDGITQFQRQTPAPVDVKSLAPLGTLTQWSLEKDWALIEITSKDVLSGLEAECEEHDTQVMNEPENEAKIVTRTSNGGNMTGTLFSTPCYTSLPASGTFEEVYRVKMDGLVENGDCGSFIRDAATGRVYGHIVAGCQQTGVAYIMAARHVFHDIEHRLTLALAELTIAQETEGNDTVENVLTLAIPKRKLMMPNFRMFLPLQKSALRLSTLLAISLFGAYFMIWTWNSLTRWLETPPGNILGSSPSRPPKDFQPYFPQHGAERALPGGELSLHWATAQWILPILVFSFTLPFRRRKLHLDLFHLLGDPINSITSLLYQIHIWRRDVEITKLISDELKPATVFPAFDDSDKKNGNRTLVLDPKIGTITISKKYNSVNLDRGESRQGQLRLSVWTSSSIVLFMIAVRLVIALFVLCLAFTLKLSSRQSTADILVPPRASLTNLGYVTFFNPSLRSPITHPVYNAGNGKLCMKTKSGTTWSNDVWCAGAAKPLPNSPLNSLDWFGGPSVFYFTADTMLSDIDHTAGNDTWKLSSGTNDTPVHGRSQATSATRLNGTSAWIYYQDREGYIREFGIDDYRDIVWRDDGNLPWHPDNHRDCLYSALDISGFDESHRNDGKSITEPIPISPGSLDCWPVCWPVWGGGVYSSNCGGTSSGVSISTACSSCFASSGGSISTACPSCSVSLRRAGKSFSLGSGSCGGHNADILHLGPYLEQAPIRKKESTKGLERPPAGTPPNPGSSSGINEFLIKEVENWKRYPSIGDTLALADLLALANLSQNLALNLYNLSISYDSAIEELRRDVDAAKKVCDELQMELNSAHERVESSALVEVQKKSSECYRFLEAHPSPNSTINGLIAGRQTENRHKSRVITWINLPTYQLEHRIVKEPFAWQQDQKMSKTHANQQLRERERAAYEGRGGGTNGEGDCTKSKSRICRDAEDSGTSSKCSPSTEPRCELFIKPERYHFGRNHLCFSGPGSWIGCLNVPV